VDALISALIGSGAVGLLAAALLIAVGALWLRNAALQAEIRTEREARLTDLREVLAALHEATAAIKAGTDGRADLTEAVREVGTGVTAVRTMLELAQTSAGGGVAPRRRG
jgi:hypothetical protein